MKKWVAGLLLLMALLSGCSSASDYQFTIKTEPKYKAEMSYPVVIEVLNDGKPVEGLEFSGFLEMAKMDHGSIQLDFEDKGNGLYESSVELPMAGEWVATLEGEDDQGAFEQVITFEVEKE